MNNKINRKIEKNKRLRNITNKYEMKKIVYKYININFLNQKIYNNNYINNLYYFQRYGKRSSSSIIKNICTQTGRARGILSFYKLSRLKLKELGSMALIPGLRRSS